MSIKVMSRNSLKYPSKTMNQEVSFSSSSTDERTQAETSSYIPYIPLTRREKSGVINEIKHQGDRMKRYSILLETIKDEIKEIDDELKVCHSPKKSPRKSLKKSPRRSPKKQPRKSIVSRNIELLNSSSLDNLKTEEQTNQIKLRTARYNHSAFPQSRVKRILSSHIKIKFVNKFSGI